MHIFIIFSILVLIETIFYILRLKKSVKEELTFSKKIQKSQYPANPNYEEDLSILYAEIMQRTNEINQKLLQIHNAVSIKTKAEIVKEIELLKTQLMSLENSLLQVKTQQENKKTELQQQIASTWAIFSEIKQMLEIDYESLLKQREYLKKEIERQQQEYTKLLSKYNSEITNLTKVLEDMKTKYPQELLSKLQLEVVQKTRVLEKIEQAYNNTQINMQQKIKFLDEVLLKKSAELEQWFSSIKQKNESELLLLKDNIDTLKQEVETLTTQLKKVLSTIAQEQQQKTSIINQLNTELKNIKSRQYEIESLKSKEQFLTMEIERLNKEYEQLQSEYRTLITQKANQIKQLKLVTEKQIVELTNSWQQQEKFYKSEISRLEKRIETLQKRKERLVLIERKLQNEFSKKQKQLQQELNKEKIEFNKKKTELETNIRKNISYLETTVEEYKQKVQQMKQKIQYDLQKYNDKINELKRRSEIREQRIRKDIAKSHTEFETMMYNLIQQITQQKEDVLETTRKLRAEEELQKSKLVVQNEQLETFQCGIQEIVKKIMFVKTEIEKFDFEIQTTEKQIYEKFSEIINMIVDKKQQLIHKLTELLEQQDRLIIKIPEVRKEKEIVDSNL